ncbi:MAG TPA: hypothetical protein VFA07_03610 [Chthonomonadaceae bacterium]|nr:hypothetical protein [Chthonomonadaceae bacterium]
MNTPILMITLQIPVRPETNADEILDIIGRQLNEALQQIKQQQLQEETDFTLGVGGPAEETLDERMEGYSDSTRQDLLAKLGYASDV